MKPNTTLETIKKLDNVAVKMNQVMGTSNPEIFRKDAIAIKTCIKELRNIINKHSEINFEYTDVIENMYSYYRSNCVPIINLFTGYNIYINFRFLNKISKKIILSNGAEINYTKKIKIGNSAIGQVYLEDGKEVYSPRHAIIHSLSSSAKMIRDWSMEVKNKLIKEI